MTNDGFDGVVGGITMVFALLVVDASALSWALFYATIGVAVVGGLIAAYVVSTEP